MAEIELLATPEKFMYITYFFPIISATFTYYLAPTRWNLIILIIASIVVIIVESHHLAFKTFASEKEKFRLTDYVRTLNLNTARNINYLKRQGAFTLFVFAWLVAYFLTWLHLTSYLQNKVAILVFIAQPGVMLFSLLTAIFGKIYMKNNIHRKYL